MENKPYPRLTGGVFFTILTNGRKARTSARDTYNGKSDGLNDPNMLAGLVRIFYPSFEMPTGNSFKSNTSRYKNCTLSKSTYLPFDNDEYVADFDYQIRNSYNTPLLKMSEFIDTYIDTRAIKSKAYAPRFITTLLDLIAADDSINDEEEFYVCPGGKTLTKRELASTQRLFLQPFLLGIWHYIVSKKIDNKIGAATIDNWLSRYIIIDAPGRRVSNREIYKELVVEYYDVPSVCEKESNQALKPAVALSGDASYDYTSYLERTKNKYIELKTLLYTDHARNFYDFYVCNMLCSPTHMTPSGVRRNRHIQNRLTEANIRKLRLSFGKNVIITGTGGLGKSMMMRHLLLDAITNYDDQKLIPFFIPLKDFNEENNNLFDFIYSKVSPLCDVSKEQLRDTFINGEALVLLDGLDEIHSSMVPVFERQIENFIDSFADNMYVISSRPFQSFVAFHSFSTAELQPFTKEQALELIEKIEFREDEPDIKNKFKLALEKNLFNTHREFANNPLLLTIMLMTFEQYAEIPSKMHIFYREAYSALSQKHDANKGGYKRQLKTGLNADRFSDYFSEFCMRTYHDEKFELTDAEFEKYFNSLKVHDRFPDENVTASAFLKDLLSAMCLMYYESAKYAFTHRSFQEYFCALFFSKQKDKTLKHIGDFFENRTARMRGDKTFSMLYDMIPDHVEEYIFIPFIEDIVSECEGADGYWTFLRKYHPTIYYGYGDTSEFESNIPESFLLNFILTTFGLNPAMLMIALPMHEEFITESYDWVLYPGQEDGEILVHGGYDNIISISPEAHKRFSDEELELQIEENVGYSLEFSIEEVLSEKEMYEDIISALDENECPLKCEYIKLKSILTSLKERHQTTTGDDFFDLF